jgi:type II secretory pathway pseudopilin PulG
MPVSRDKESGFALLLVFLMAAVIAISLYSEIPRVAFQSQRQKEQLLVERGEQYKRAVEVFFQATNGQFPRSMDDLEKYQNRRFLRHKYVDPMTGKQEWRIIHVGPGGIPTDSALSKQAKKDETSGNVSNYVTAYPGLGQDTGAAGQQAMRPESRRRPSDSSPIGDSTLPVSSPDQPEQNQNPGAAQTASG